MNKMKEFMEFLGVEEGEEFEIVGLDNLRYYFKDENLYTHVVDGFIINKDIIYAIKDGIRKLPFKPKEGERFYFPCVAGSCGYLCFDYENTEQDKKILSRTPVFRTEEEVIEYVEKLNEKGMWL